MPIIHTDAGPIFGPGSRIAVVGAGISGVTAAAHLLRQGLSVTVFERSSISGGVWHYNERTPKDTSYPSNTPSVGDYQLSSPGQYTYRTPPPDGEEAFDEASAKMDIGGDALEICFAPPGPCYAGLRNNVPTSLMASVLDPWPAGTEEITSQINLERYIQMLARNHGVDRVTQYNTRVDEIRKSHEQRWSIRTVTLVVRHKTEAQLVEKYSEFDFVVVASGHYNLPRVPSTPGLKEWKAAFGDRVVHSKQYRKAEKYRGKNVLVIGAGVSAVDICRELGEVANKIYQSVRGGLFDLPSTLLPVNAQRVPEVFRYITDDSNLASGCPQPLPPDHHIPGTVVLKDGRTLSDVDAVVIATGYIISYPFLPHLHADTVPASEAGPEVLVASEGQMAHNLHKDIFYIPDPTLAFIGVPYHVATFSLFDFQSQIVARVFAGKALLPSTADMRKEYQARLRTTGAGRSFHSLRREGGELKYVEDLVDWANKDARRLGTGHMEGHTQRWLEGHAAMRERTKHILGLDA